MRRTALACAVFAVGVFAGVAVLRPGHGGMTKQEKAASAAVALASGGRVVQVTCASDHCGVVVRRSGARACEGWIVPRQNGLLGSPRRAALVNC
jgi:hypothetical protein